MRTRQTGRKGGAEPLELAAGDQVFPHAKPGVRRHLGHPVDSRTEVAALVLAVMVAGRVVDGDSLRQGKRRRDEREIVDPRLLLEPDSKVPHEGAPEEPAAHLRAQRREEPFTEKIRGESPGQAQRLAVDRPHAIFVAGRIVEVAHAREGDVRRRRLRHPVQRAKRAAVEPVVCIAEEQILAARFVKPSVPRGSGTPVRRREVSQARIPRRIFREHLRGAVGGAVVDADDLDVLQRLPEDGIKAFAEMPLGVVDGDDDRDMGHFAPPQRMSTGFPVPPRNLRHRHRSRDLNRGPVSGSGRRLSSRMAVIWT